MNIESLPLHFILSTDLQSLAKPFSPDSNLEKSDINNPVHF